MTLDFINVGYGDAILIRSGSFTMLVDCGDWTVGDGGPDSQRISAADFLRQEGIRSCFYSCPAYLLSPGKVQINLLLRPAYSYF